MSAIAQLLVSLLTFSRIAPAGSTSIDEGARAAAAQAALVAASGSLGGSVSGHRITAN